MDPICKYCDVKLYDFEKILCNYCLVRKGGPKYENGKMVLEIYSNRRKEPVVFHATNKQTSGEIADEVVRLFGFSKGDTPSLQMMDGRTLNRYEMPPTKVTEFELVFTGTGV